jgi:pimeloyl-ACP methyl ester carboxylesterase
VHVVAVRYDAVEVGGLDHENGEHAHADDQSQAHLPPGAGRTDVGRDRLVKVGFGEVVSLLLGFTRRHGHRGTAYGTPGSETGEGGARPAVAATMVHNLGGEVMRVRTDDGVELAVEIDGSGPGLLLVHGHGGAKEDFSDHAERLARYHTVVTFDHRGHGASDHPSEPAAYSLARMRADTWAVADAVGLDRFRVLGHSMGGMVVRRMPLEQPERIEALMLMDTSAGPIPALIPELVEAAAYVGLTEGKDALKVLLDTAGALDTEAYQRLLVDRPGYREFQERKWADTSEVMWGTIACEIARQPDDLPLLRELTCPTLVIVGALDIAFVDGSYAMAQTIPRARLEVIEAAGHSPQFEAPEQWIDALERFLAGLPAPVA